MKTPIIAIVGMGLLLLAGIVFGGYYSMTLEANEEAGPLCVAVEDDDLTASASADPCQPEPEPEPQPEPDPTPQPKPSPGADLEADDPVAESPEKPDPNATINDIVRQAELIHGLETEEAQRIAVEKLLEKLLQAEQEILANLDDFEATFSGTVVDAYGNPVAGAQVVGSLTVTGEATKIDLKSSRLYIHGDYQRTFATTDAAGAFKATVSRKVLKGTTSVKITLVARAKAHADGESTSFTLENGQELTGRNLRLRAAGSVRGRVVDASGIAMKGARVSLYAASSGRGGRGYWRGNKHAITDASGEFQVKGLTPGRYRLSLYAPGFRQKSGPTEVEVQAGAETVLATDFVVAVAAAVKVRVTDESGKSLTGYVQVRVYNDAGKRIRILTGQLDGSGNALCAGVPIGGYHFEVYLPGYKPGSKTFATVTADSHTDLGTFALAHEVSSLRGEENGLDRTPPPPSGGNGGAKKIVKIRRR